VKFIEFNEIVKSYKIVKNCVFFGFFWFFDENFDFLGVLKKGQKRGVFGQKRAFFNPFFNA